MDLSMSLNCSVLLFTQFKSMRDIYFIDEQRNADMLDALADLAYEQEQAMREEWDADPGPEISVEERNACDHYNERYLFPTDD